MFGIEDNPHITTKFGLKKVMVHSDMRMLPFKDLAKA